MLSKRLQKIADLVDEAIIADIGTDHAFIPIYLIEKNICKRAIACDIETGPLSAAKENIKEHGLSIETRLGNGISVLRPNEVDEIIIAGMGGEEICKILLSNEEISRNTKFILQPMTRQAELRKFLYDNKYKIEKEELVLDDKLYNIIILSTSAPDMVIKKELDFHIPPALKSHDLYKELINKKQREFNKRLSGLKKAKISDKEQIEYFEALLGELNEIS